MVKLKRRRGDDEWVDALRSALGRQHDEVVEFVRTGAVQPVPPVDPSTLHITASYTQAQLMQMAEGRRRADWHAAVTRASVDWLSLTRSMPPPVLGRFAQLIGVYFHAGAPQPPQWLAIALQRPNDTVLKAPMSRIEEAGGWLGYSPDDVIRFIFTRLRDAPRQPDFGHWVAANIDRIGQIMRPELATNVGHWKRIAWGGRELVASLHIELVAALTASAKTTRAAARMGLAVVDFASIEGDLKRVARDGDPTSRAAAVDLLTELVPDARREEMAGWLIEHCASDRVKAVREAVARFAAAPAALGNAGRVELPHVDMDVSLPKDFRHRLLGSFEPHKGVRSGWEEVRAQRTITVLEGNLSDDPLRAVHDLTAATLKDRAFCDGLAPAHLARALLYGCRAVVWHPEGAAGIIRTTGHPTPLELQVVADRGGFDAATVHSVVTSLLGGCESAVWPRDEIEAWVLHQLPALLHYLTVQTISYTFSRPGLFKALAAVTTRPEPLTRALLDCGLAGLKTDQRFARDVLGSDARDLLMPFLAASKVAERAGAASWLREFKDPSTEANLRTAIAREQHDTAKAQMLLALEAIGASLEEYLAPDRLLADATAGLSKKGAIPATIDWLDFGTLPAVHWNDGTPVDPTIFRWFAASAVKSKVVEPSPLLRRHAASMRTDEVRAFGEALFEAWLRRDLAPRPREECERVARQTAISKIRWADQDPRGEAYPEYKGLTEEQGMLLELPRVLDQPAGSATDCKGLLSLVAAMGGPELAPRAHAYAKKWRGFRLHQAKAMLQMLAWMEYPAAIQVVLTIAQRFRPKGLQDEAAAQAASLAERRGWTLEDLADRTVPRGGFDDDGRLRIDYGDRSFTAHLRDDLTIELTADATGKTIKSLPAARQDEDATEIKALQQDLTAAKKEVRATAKLQPERLFVSMCTERTWDADDFVRYIVNHPIMRRLATRLAWIVEEGDDRRLFRPLSDGTLIDIDDEEVILADDATVLIAHDAHVTPGVSSRWIQHFADYSVAPLFPQFGRPMPPNSTGTMIDDVKGHLINSLALRGAINKYGWELGAPQDGGIVWWIQKQFAGAGITACVELTGTPAYADDSTTALLSTYFNRSGAVGDSARAVPLTDLPRILLQETYGEVLAIAAAGSGYDPDYEKKTTYG